MGAALGVAGAHGVGELLAQGPRAATPALADLDIDEPPPPEPAPPGAIEDPSPPEATAPRAEAAPTRPSASAPPAPAPAPRPARAAATTKSPPEAGESKDASPRARFVPRPGSPPPLTRRIPPGAMPNQTAARATLAARARDLAGTGAAERDLDFVLRLQGRYRGDGVPAPRRRAVALTTSANAWWFASRDAPERGAILRDPAGRIYTYRAGRGFALNPVATTGRWHDINADVPAPRLADALLEVAVPRRSGERTFLAWEYYDVPDRPGVIRPGTSGMAQGRLARLLAQSYRTTGERRFAEASLQALRAFTVAVDAGGVRSIVDDPRADGPGPWYVERAYPGESAWKGGALNGFMVALLNLRGARKRLAEPPRLAAETPPPRLEVAETGAQLAAHLADEGADTLERYLPLHDKGDWSYYGLLTPGLPWRSYVADLNYHCYHVKLLVQLARLYPERNFEQTAARWADYAETAGTGCDRS